MKNKTKVKPEDANSTKNMCTQNDGLSSRDSCLDQPDEKVSVVRSKDICSINDPQCYRADDITDLDGNYISTDKHSKSK